MENLPCFCSQQRVCSLFGVTSSLCSRKAFLDSLAQIPLCHTRTFGKWKQGSSSFLEKNMRDEWNRKCQTSRMEGELLNLYVTAFAYFFSFARRPVMMMCVVLSTLPSFSFSIATTEVGNFDFLLLQSFPIFQCSSVPGIQQGDVLNQIPVAYLIYSSYTL